MMSVIFTPRSAQPIFTRRCKLTGTSIVNRFMGSVGSGSASGSDKAAEAGSSLSATRDATQESAESADRVGDLNETDFFMMWALVER